MSTSTFSALSRRGFIVVAAGSLLTACMSSRPGFIPANATDETSGALPLVNALRSSKGLSTLSGNGAARAAAAQQAARMAKADQMSHLIGVGDSFLTRMKSAEVSLPAAENIASGQDNVTRAVQAWIDSPRHLENMLGRYGGLGVAVARDPASGNRPYWAMVLSA